MNEKQTTTESSDSRETINGNELLRRYIRFAGVYKEVIIAAANDAGLSNDAETSFQMVENMLSDYIQDNSDTEHLVLIDKKLADMRQAMNDNEKLKEEAVELIKAIRYV